MPLPKWAAQELGVVGDVLGRCLRASKPDIVTPGPLCVTEYCRIDFLRMSFVSNLVVDVERTKHHTTPHQRKIQFTRSER